MGMCRGRRERQDMIFQSLSLLEEGGGWERASLSWSLPSPAPSHRVSCSRSQIWKLIQSLLNGVSLTWEWRTKLSALKIWELYIRPWSVPSWPCCCASPAPVMEVSATADPSPSVLLPPAAAFLQRCMIGSGHCPCLRLVQSRNKSMMKTLPPKLAQTEDLNKLCYMNYRSGAVTFLDFSSLFCMCICVCSTVKSSFLRWNSIHEGERSVRGLTLVQGLRQHLSIFLSFFFLFPLPFRVCRAECVRAVTLRMFALKAWCQKAGGSAAEAPLWFGGELRSLCRQRWMALSESRRTVAGRAAPYPRRASRDESLRGGVCEGVRVAAVAACVYVCVCLGGWDAGRPRPTQWPHSAAAEAATDTSQFDMMQPLFLLLLSVSAGAEGCAVSGWGESGMWMWSWNSIVSSSRCNIVHVVSWHDQLWAERSCGARCLCNRLSELQTLAANSTSIKLGQTSPCTLADGVKKWLLICNGGVALCFCVTESKLSWRAGISSSALWSFRGKHEKSHLPFCLLIYR